jgi:hypothetical protein
MSNDRAMRNSEMAFFKRAQTFYDAALDANGDIKKSLSHLKKKLSKSGKGLPADKWARLDSALRSGEITRGKKSTPSDWAAAEVRRHKAGL